MWRWRRTLFLCRKESRGATVSGLCTWDTREAGCADSWHTEYFFRGIQVRVTTVGKSSVHTNYRRIPELPEDKPCHFQRHSARLGLTQAQQSSESDYQRIGFYVDDENLRGQGRAIVRPCRRENDAGAVYYRCTEADSGWLQSELHPRGLVGFV